jgi:hypothetical protein
VCAENHLEFRQQKGCIMDIAPGNEHVHNFLKSILNHISDKLIRSTLPIVYDSTEQASVCGTAVLFRVLDCSMLLSASHVLELSKESAFGQALGIPLTEEEMLPLASGDIYRAFDDDNFDVGFVELPQYAVDLLQKHRKAEFLTIGDVENIDHRTPPPGGYVVFGYPDKGVECSNEKITPIPHYFNCAPHRGDTSELPHTYNPAVHFLLRFDRSTVRNIETGELSEAPHPAGMSGGSVWWTYSPDDIANGWDPTYARFVGIQSAYFCKSGLLKVIPWRYMQSIIIKIKPGWERALKLRSSGRLTHKLIAKKY